MTDRPYTDADLRAEAARQHKSLTEDPDFMGIGEMMDGSDPWDSLGEDDFDTAQREIDDLLSKAADVSEWAVNLGADDLEPVRHRVHINDQGVPRVRVHFAFASDLSEDARKEIVQLVGDAIKRT